ncbi:folate-binding protein YgfZ [Sinimarinibacterium sp. CAU 1509]|uniref:CAF17-like 4Fe-4S cluster assembly/insertion protein YgfZ n=1 Tax=Sinimarinibacterium sp. CAU 1509 TaxID=2562283 RepID=UPI0010ACAA78|nr:folate-binding protein YgfZ [Sinimarinibacterium sp. CAU 1509]TJY63084.1 folate-binding protein YgfZ [Sinimarinibacterium sp. CAU 1509]
MNTTIGLPLDELTLLRASGADAREFLQGQLSSDLRKLSPQAAQISSYNSPKGRMLAVLHLIQDEESVLIELHASIASAVIGRLRMFVLRSRVTLDEPGPALRSIGLIGPDAASALAALGLSTPDAAMACSRNGDGLCALRRHGATPRYSVVGPGAAVEAAAQTLSRSCTLNLDAPFEVWRRAQIEAGEPVVVTATSDHFVPQMANLDQLGGIAFDKGCYTGQEIVARLHYLGNLKRRLFVCDLDGAAPQAGDDVLSGDSTVGEIVDAVGDGHSAIASAVLQLEHVAAQDLRLRSGASLRPRISSRST